MQEVFLNERPFRVRSDRPEIADFWSNAVAGGWERETLDFLSRTLTPERWFLDVGAWIGPVSLAASTYGAGVVALEPDPTAFAELEANFLANGIAGEAVNAAVDRDRGELVLHSFKGAGSSCTSVLQRETGGERFTTPTITLGDALARVPEERDLVIKVDIESHEYAIADDIVAVFAEPRVKALHLSLHPGVIWRTAKAGRAEWMGRRGLWRATADLARRLAGLSGAAADEALHRRNILFAWKIRNYAMSFEKI